MEMPNNGRRLPVLALIVFIASAKAEVIDVCQDGCPYQKIQDAIDAASDGDMISVESGVYYESINLSKRLTVRGLGTGEGLPALVNNSSVVIISANRTIVDGFNISGSKEAGIKVLSWGNTLLGNDLRQNYLGIEVLSGENIITKNNISDNDLGIKMENASKNIITFNNISHNKGHGLMLHGSAFNILAGNAISGNLLGDGLNESIHNFWYENSHGTPDINISNEACDRQLPGGVDLGIYFNLKPISIEQSLPPKEAYILMQENQDLVVIDVRTPEEYESGRLEGVINLDYYSYGFLDSLKSLDKNSTYIVYCKRGYRGSVALEMMRALGFKDIYNILGGMTQWAEEGLPMIGEVMQ